MHFSEVNFFKTLNVFCRSMAMHTVVADSQLR